jgi:hypothetical protein
MDIIDYLSKLTTENEKQTYKILALIAPIVLCYILFPDNFPNSNTLSVLYVVFFASMFKILYTIPVNKKVEIYKRMFDNVMEPMNDKKDRFKEIKKDLLNLKDKWSDKSEKAVAFHSVYESMINSIDKRIRQIDELIEKIEHLSQRYYSLDPEEMYNHTVEKNHKAMVYLLFITTFVLWVLKIFPVSPYTSDFYIYNIIGFIVVFFILTLLCTLSLGVYYQLQFIS